MCMHVCAFVCACLCVHLMHRNLRRSVRGGHCIPQNCLAGAGALITLSHLSSLLPHFLDDSHPDECKAVSSFDLHFPND